MQSKVQKWGNSQGIRIPKNLLKRSHIKVGDEVDIHTSEGKIIIEPSRRIRGKYDINELINKMPRNDHIEEENWGKPLGKEEW